MIVSAQDSGVLEFFWRHPVNTSVFRIRPADFFSLRTRQADVLQMREWLSVQPGCESIRSLRDPKVVKQIAWAIKSREMALAVHQPFPRFPGTGVVIESVYGPVLLLPFRTSSREGDLAYALGWLPTISDPETLQNLRSMLSSTDNPSGRSLRESTDLVSDVEHLLRSGELIAVFRSFPSREHNEIHEDQPIPGAETDRSRDREETPDPATFGSDHRVMAQSAAMMAAADSGIPFCEVCNKK